MSRKESVTHFAALQNILLIELKTQNKEQEFASLEVVTAPLDATEHLPHPFCLLTSCQ